MELGRIRLIREDVAIWLVYAGRGRRYFDTFQTSGSIFLNLPGYEANERVFASTELMRRHLAMSDEIFQWVIGSRNDPPSRNAASYSPYPHKSGTTDAKSFSAEIGNIQRMFVEAKVGDLILSPPYGHFEPFLIGEITHRWRKEDDLELPSLNNEKVPVRKVRWLNSALARRDFPPRVSRRMQNQLAISKLDERYYEEVLRLVYPSFVWGEQSKIDIFGENYAGTDPLQPYAPALLIKYVLASVFAFEQDSFDKFQSLEPLDAIDQFYREDLIEHFGQTFNSPGRYSVIAALSSLAVLSAAGMVVATSDVSTPFSQVQTEAREEVKGTLKGPGKTSLENDLDNYVNSMKAVNWRKVQKQLGEPANSSMTLSMNNTAEVASHRAELNAK